jgi:threonine synthase
VLADLYATDGKAVAVADAELMEACRALAELEGIFAAPEGGAGLAAVARLVAERKIDRDERIVVFNTGSGYKYLEAWQAELA